MTRRHMFLMFVVLAGLAGGWWAIAHFAWLPPFLFPSPGDVLGAFASQWIDLLGAAVSTTLTALAGFGMAICFGMATGVVLHRSRFLRAMLLPILVSLKSTPVVALVPLVALILGVGFLSKLFIAFLICFFPMVLSTLSGLENVPPGLRDFASAVGAGRLRYSLYVALPSAANQLLLGMKITLPLAIVGAVVAEMAGGYGTGLGYVIISASYRLDAPLLYAAVGLIMLVSATVYYLFNWIAGAFYPPFLEGTRS